MLVLLLSLIRFHIRCLSSETAIGHELPVSIIEPIKGHASNNSHHQLLLGGHQLFILLCSPSPSFLFYSIRLALGSAPFCSPLSSALSGTLCGACLLAFESGVPKFESFRSSHEGTVRDDPAICQSGCPSCKVDMVYFK